VLRGGVPVFVDIRCDTLNLDESLVEAAVTPRTRAIVPVHYAGVGCEMDRLLEVAGKHRLAVIEDAAQGLMTDHRGQALGGIGALGAVSFHESKNVISGEGGALLVNDPALVERAEIIREKILQKAREEVPYSVAVEIDRFVEEGKLARIDASVVVDKDSQKAIVIGRHGERLKAAGTYARIEMERLFGMKVFLQLWVKVRSGWREDEQLLTELGY